MYCIHCPSLFIHLSFQSTHTHWSSSSCQTLWAMNNHHKYEKIWRTPIASQGGASPLQPVSRIDYRKTVGKHTKATTWKKIREENLKLKFSYRDKFLCYFSSFAFPLWPKWFPLGFVLFCFIFLFLLFFLPGLHQGQPKSWICNVITITPAPKSLGEKSMFLAKVTQIKGSLWYKKSGEMTFMFLPLSLPLYSHHLVLRVAPVIHNYGI